jgi:hypothetical protein
MSFDGQPRQRAFFYQSLGVATGDEHVHLAVKGAVVTDESLYRKTGGRQHSSRYRLVCASAGYHILFPCHIL